MNTPAHLIFAAAAFARPGRWRVNAAALAGGLLPDLSLYLLVGWALFVQGNAPEFVFGTQYFSTLWQGIFAVDNSFVIWGGVLAVGLLQRSGVTVAFAGAGLLHLLFDFLLHNDDARRHFWPVSDFVFRSPVSYWNPAHYGHIAGPAEILVCLLLCAILWRRFSGRLARVLIVLAAVAELAPGVIIALMFANG